MGPPEKNEGRSAAATAGPAVAEYQFRGRIDFDESDLSGEPGASQPRRRRRIEIIAKIEPDGPRIRVRGRQAWALELLIHAGKHGVTPMEKPGPRWSHYIYALRRLGFVIETIDEPHGGPFAGTHARYVLRSLVRVEEREAPR